MKTTTTECAALLQTSRTVHMVELLTLTLIDGTALRWAGTDVAVSYGGNTWVPGPIIERDQIKSQTGISVSSLNLTLHVNDSITVLGLPLLQAARRGVLDGASVLIQKAFTDNPANPLAGTVHLFEGRVADIEINSTTARLEVKSFTELLDTQVPLDVYQASCLNTLYGTACGLTKSANALNLSVAAGTTLQKLVCSVTGSGTYDLGELVFTSGVNAGVRRAVKSHTAGQLLLSFPLPDAPSVGDTFTVYKGCDKTLTTCRNKFSNAVHFRGFPFVPAPETAV